MSFKYLKANHAQALVWRLELQKGQAKSKPTLSITKLNRRIVELEAMPDAKAAAAKLPTPQPKVETPLFSRRQCETIMAEVFHESRMCFAQVTDPDLHEDTIARICAAKLVCPGINEKSEHLSGTAAVFRGIRQDALDRVFETDLFNQK